eukprot:Rmarinus@m.9513
MFGEALVDILLLPFRRELVEASAMRDDGVWAETKFRAWRKMVIEGAMDLVFDLTLSRSGILFEIDSEARRAVVVAAYGPRGPTPGSSFSLSDESIVAETVDGRSPVYDTLHGDVLRKNAAVIGHDYSFRETRRAVLCVPLFADNDEDPSTQPTGPPPEVQQDPEGTSTAAPLPTINIGPKGPLKGRVIGVLMILDKRCKGVSFGPHDCTAVATMAPVLYRLCFLNSTLSATNASGGTRPVSPPGAKDLFLPFVDMSGCDPEELRPMMSRAGSIAESLLNGRVLAGDLRTNSGDYEFEYNYEDGPKDPQEGESSDETGSEDNDGSVGGQAAADGDDLDDVNDGGDFNDFVQATPGASRRKYGRESYTSVASQEG